MCLGIPGRVAKWIDKDPIFARAEVEFAGIRREVQMACAVDAVEGDYVIVHAGVAICILNEAEAEKTLSELAMLGESEGSFESDGEQMS
jgi:hydrogenase expression/formation protein HypC